MLIKWSVLAICLYGSVSLGGQTETTLTNDEYAVYASFLSGRPAGEPFQLASETVDRASWDWVDPMDVVRIRKAFNPALDDVGLLSLITRVCQGNQEVSCRRQRFSSS